MRILHVIHSANPEGGGPIEAVKQLAAVHERLGHRVEVASLDAPDASWISRSERSIHTLGGSPSRYGFSSRIVPWLRKRRHDFDIVVSHGLWQFNGMATRRALRNSGTASLVFPHGMLDPWFKKRYPLKHLKKWLYWLAMEHRVLRDADGVLFTCEEERMQARGTFWPYQCNETVVSFGTASPPDEPERQVEAFFQEFPELANKRLFLFLGRIHEKKGCRELIEAFRRVCPTTPSEGNPFHLVMAGPADNEYGRSLQEQTRQEGMSDRITWAGMLRDDVKWGAFRAAEAFVLPSHQENFGIAVAEALACGVPVLISDKVNIWREIDADRAGLIKCDTLDGTTQLLNRWTAMGASERQMFSARARACFVERFEISQAARHVLEVFEQVVARKAADRAG